MTGQSTTLSEKKYMARVLYKVWWLFVRCWSFAAKKMLLCVDYSNFLHATELLVGGGKMIFWYDIHALISIFTITAQYHNCGNRHPATRYESCHGNLYKNYLRTYIHFSITWPNFSKLYPTSKAECGDPIDRTLSAEKGSCPITRSLPLESYSLEQKERILRRCA